AEPDRESCSGPLPYSCDEIPAPSREWTQRDLTRDGRSPSGPGRVESADGPARPSGTGGGACPENSSRPRSLPLPLQWLVASADSRVQVSFRPRALARVLSVPTVGLAILPVSSLLMVARSIPVRSARSVRLKPWRSRSRRSPARAAINSGSPTGG